MTSTYSRRGDCVCAVPVPVAMGGKLVCYCCLKTVQDAYCHPGRGRKGAEA